MPHAPYSVSNALFKLIQAHKNNNIVSIHNQESEEENLLFLTGKSGFEVLYQTLGINAAFFTKTNTHSIGGYLPFLNPTTPTLFVHNTFINQNDIDIIKQTMMHPYFCICPRANMYIENKMPPIDLLIANNCNIVVGTDSLASNFDLNLLNELIFIAKNHQNMRWELKTSTHDTATLNDPQPNCAIVRNEMKLNKNKT